MDKKLYTHEQALEWIEKVEGPRSICTGPGLLSLIMGLNREFHERYTYGQINMIIDAVVDCDLEAFRAFEFECETQPIEERSGWCAVGDSLVYMCWRGLTDVPEKTESEFSRYLNVTARPMKVWEYEARAWDERNHDPDELVLTEAELNECADKILDSGALSEDEMSPPFEGPKLSFSPEKIAQIREALRPTNDDRLPQGCAKLREDLANIQTHPMDIPQLPESMIGQSLPQPTDQPYEDAFQSLCIDLEVLKGRLHDDWKAGMAILWEGRNDKGQSDRARSMLEKVIACKSTLEAALYEAKS